MHKSEEQIKRLVCLFKHRFPLLVLHFICMPTMSSGQVVVIPAGKQSWNSSCASADGVGHNSRPSRSLLLYGLYCCPAMQSESSAMSILLVDAPKVPTPTNNVCPLSYKMVSCSKKALDIQYVCRDFILKSCIWKTHWTMFPNVKHFKWKIVTDPELWWFVFPISCSCEIHLPCCLLIHLTILFIFLVFLALYFIRKTFPSS